jgi:hypothetical protein
MHIYSGIVEDKTRGGIDGDCARVCDRIRYLASMKLKSIELWLPSDYIRKNECADEQDHSLTCGMGGPWELRNMKYEVTIEFIKQWTWEFSCVLETFVTQFWREIHIQRLSS